VSVEISLGAWATRQRIDAGRLKQPLKKFTFEKFGIKPEDRKKVHCHNKESRRAEEAREILGFLPEPVVSER
jgi:hypothetical protein